MLQRTRYAFCIALLAVCLPSLCSAQERRAFERLDEVDWQGWKELSGLLDDVRAHTGVPALAAACVRDGKIVAEATVGVRAFGSAAGVAADDRFHLGSVTKSFTAVVIGKLVEEGQLRWDTRVEQVLADIEMRDAYRSVTVEQLLQHRGGLPAYTERRPAGHDANREYSGTPTEQRAAFLADVLVQEPIGASGGTASYSNAGYALAGHMAECVAGKSWEDLVRRYVFEPLGMRSGGFGVPDQPRGHAGNGPEFKPVPTDAYPAMDTIAPAGNIHCSVGDLARYARAHLDGLAGEDGFLQAATVQRLHAVPDGGGAMRFASGWIATEDASGDPVHRHGGTIGASYADVQLYPARRCAVIVLTNVGPGVGEPLASQVAQAMVQRFAPAMTGFVRAEASEPIPMTEGKATAADDARLWQVVKKLSQAINDEDRGAYRALFAPSYDRQAGDEMLEFMTRQVLPVRGGVHAFHSPRPPLQQAGVEWPLRVVVFHLENGFPGYFGIALNDDGLIAEFSLFVKGDLCPNGTDRKCAHNVRTLDKDFK